jgi:hypothetical protein
MNEGIKMFLCGFGTGIIIAIICLCGCYIYSRTVRKSSADSNRVGDIEQKQSEICTGLAENEQRTAELIQKAKDILDTGKRTNVS